MTASYTRSQKPVTAKNSYDDRWDWDEVRWVSHCIDCYPGNCTLRAYLKDGKVVREEQAGVYQTVQDGVPDMNPMGCQKGVGWTKMLDGEERVTHPLKRVGERGSGKWERISWDQAATEVADAILDAIEEIGPESVIAPSGCNTGGEFAGNSIGGRGKFMGSIGGLITDVNAEMNDFAPGYYLTYGTFDPVSSIDDWFHSEVFIIWFGNPNYTRIPHIHYVNEARYNGCEVVTIAPDVSPSAMHADYHVPVKVGSDASLALAMAKVVIDEGLMNEQFVIEQTDLPLLVNPTTNRFLRESDLREGGSDEQFYAWDTKTGGAVLAPRGTLRWGEALPALEGKFTVPGKDGPIAVTTVFSMVRARLDEYTPERAEEITGVHAETIRLLARKIAKKKTNILGALGGAGKHYHGDLIERAQLLLLALTGNWGRQGTGVRAWLAGMVDGMATVNFKQKRGPAETAAFLDMREAALAGALANDPSMTPALLAIEQTKQACSGGGVGMVPPVFYWYNHAGYHEAWNRQDWHDPAMSRPFDDYFQEAVQKGWWRGVAYPTPEQTPRVLIECGGNVIRRTRGGGNMLLQHLWPKLNMIVTLDPRMSATALVSDIVLPIAHQYEKISHGIPTTHLMNLTFGDKVVEPPGEAVGEWEAFRRLTEKLEERAKARGIHQYRDARGGQHDLTVAYAAYTKNGEFVDEEVIADEILRDCAMIGTLPPHASLEELRKEGYFRWQSLGLGARAVAQATDPKPNETFVPFRNHVEKGEPYPTLTRRAQFLIEHEWFIEADEHLPRHKDAPAFGGNYPFTITSGHNRWSLHSLNIANRLMLDTHRGTPHLVMNDQDAARLGITDNETVRVFNDQGEFWVPILTSGGAQPGQLAMYNGFEPYQFPNWSSPNDVEPGMVKWLHLAGGYGHLKYWPMEWQPCTVIRGTRVAIEKA
ncbi:MAG: molybdopterin-dependent oxidoreductase [Dehalococcoidia bacterium]|nr:molybdopterin-dependent oxidoreductase [Dehalococcoidia bacterium]